MSFLMVVLVIGPYLLLALSLSDNVSVLVKTVKSDCGGEPVEATAWLSSLPLVGEYAVRS